MTEYTKARAERYREYLLGWAYIPPQDLPLYEKSYNKIYKDKDQKKES